MRFITRVIADSFLRVVAPATAAALLLGGCQAIAVTAAGIGASTGLTHTASSISYRTFTAPEPQVRQATLIALERMGVKVETAMRHQAVETIRASVSDRFIEIEVEVLTPSATRISSIAQRGLFVYDSATAREIVVQTELAMIELAAPRKLSTTSNVSSASADSGIADPPLAHR